MADISLLQHALHYYSLGANVLAIGRDETGRPSKAPVGAWSRWQTERQTEADVQTLLAKPHTGLAVISGIGGFHCLDIDRIVDFEIVERMLYNLGLGDSYQWCVRSGSGNGAHIWFCCNEAIPEGVLSTSAAGIYTAKSSDGSFDHLELRYAHCYTLVPPSLHQSGKGYTFTLSPAIPRERPATVSIAQVLEVLRTYTIQTLPRSIGRDEHPVQTATPLLRSSANNEQYTTTPAFSDSYVTMAVVDEIEVLLTAQEGNRNHALYQAALKLSNFIPVSNLTRTDLVNLLTRPALQIGLAPGEIQATIESGVNNGILHPRQPAGSHLSICNGQPSTALDLPRQAETNQNLVALAPANFFVDEDGAAAGENSWYQRGLYTPAAFTAKALATFNQKHTSIEQGIPLGLHSTFFPQLSKKVGGFKGSELTLIGARTSAGKTAFALQLAYDFAIVQKKRVAFLSLEMGGTQVFERIVSFHHRVDLMPWRNAELSPQKNAYIKRCFVETGELITQVSTLYIFDNSELYCEDVATLVSYLYEVCGIECIILDYVGFVLSRTGRTQEEEYANAIRDIRRASKHLNVPFFVLAQLNRQADTRGKEKEPEMSNLRGSGRLEQDAQNVILLHRHKALKHPEGEPESGKLIVEKARDGATGEIAMLFRREYAMWEEAPNSSLFIPRTEQERRAAAMFPFD